jgi:hypothetical protein
MASSAPTSISPSSGPTSVPSSAPTSARSCRTEALLAAAALCASLLGPAPVRAQIRSEQAASELIEDIASFRSALGSVFANVVIVEGVDRTVARIEATPAGIVVTARDAAPVTWSATSGDDVARRLVALTLSTGDGAAQLRAWPCSLRPSVSGFMLFAGSGDETLVRRIGDPERCHLSVEPDIARPREWGIVRNGVSWLARAVTYSSASSGWYPSRVEVLRDGVVAMVVELRAVAPSADVLPALEPEPRAAPAPAVPGRALPRRLPL